MRLRDVITDGKRALAAAGLQCADPLLHMKQIAELALGITTTRLYLRWDDELTPAEAQRIDDLLSRRLTGEPFQYIAGREGFWDADYAVGPGVLIPRRETERLVEVLLERNLAPHLKIAELGPGTGNIGISALRERPGWEWHAYELNVESLPYLERNHQALLPAAAHYAVHHGDFFALAPLHAPFDWLVSNPPYVSRESLSHLSREVRHEPVMALDGGDLGLEVLRHLVTASASLLRPGGGVLFEIGYDQGPAMKHLLEQAGFANAEILSDYAGLPRVALGMSRK